MHKEGLMADLMRNTLLLSILTLAMIVIAHGETAAQNWACKGKTGCESIGSTCPDGTIFAGCSPPSYQPVYATRCDAGRFWNGTNCTGTMGWQVLAAGDETSCGIKLDGSAYCWGNDAALQLGNGATTGNQLVPSALSGGGAWKSIQAGWQIACGIKSDDTAWCWGENWHGALGNGDNIDQDAPVAVSGGTAYKMISVGNEAEHVCAIRASDDALYCWGNNASGELGDNTTNNSNVPVAVNGGGAWKYVATGYAHTCGIKSDDTAWCWGYNPFGAVGDNTQGTNRLVPTAVNGGGAWKRISAGYEHSCGIKSDDTAWCWGYRANGAIGDGTYGAAVLVPTAVSGGYRWKEISVGNNHSCGIRTDGVAMCWGTNDYGQLGDNTTNTTNAPVAVNGGGTWRSISANWLSTCGIKTDDRGFCWAENNTGRVGDNTSGNVRYVPTAINGSAGSRLSVPWNNGNATGKTNVSLSWIDGASNTTTLAASDSDSGTGGTQPHQAAAYCNGLTIHNYTDWFLPASAELVTITSYLSPTTQDIVDWELYWSSTHGQNTTSDAQGKYGGPTHPGSYGVSKETASGTNGPWIRCVRKE